MRLIEVTLLLACGMILANGFFHQRCDTDYVVVGAGVGGCVFARRAAEQGYKVLILEEGPASSSGDIDVGEQPNYISQDTRVPRNAGSLGSFNKRMRTAPTTNLGGATSSTGIGNLLGGGSTTNGMLYARPSMQEFEEWPQNWNSDVMLEAFKIVEDASAVNTDSSLRGQSGLLKLERNEFSTGLTDLLLANADKVGLSIQNDYNANNTKTGIQRVELPRKNGLRQDAYTAYVASAPAEVAQNIQVETGASVTRVNIRKFFKKAEGVYADVAGEEQYFCADKGVVLAAGAIFSPIILERSGVGDPDILASQGMDPKDIILENREVGRNLQDHIGYIANFITLSTSNDVYTNSTLLGEQSNQFLNSRDGLFADTPINLVLFSNENGSPVANFEASLIEGITTPTSNVTQLVSFSTQCVDIKSRGEVHYSGNPEIPWENTIDANWGSQQEELDCLAGGIQRIVDLMGETGIGLQQILAIRGGAISLSNSTLLTASEIAQELQFSASQKPFSVFHFTSSLALDKVVDPDTLQVFGYQSLGRFRWRRQIRNLFAVDASIHPKIPRTNTMALTYAAAEYASSIILDSDLFDEVLEQLYH